MKTRITKWTVLAVAALAMTFAGASQAEAGGPTLSISLGRRLVRPTTVVHTGIVTPAVVPVTHPHFIGPVYTPYYDAAVMPVGHPAYPYMVGVSTVRRGVVVRRAVVGRTVVGRTIYSGVYTPGFVARIGY